MRTMSLLEFAAELERIAELEMTNKLVIEAGCQMIQHEAKSVLGTYNAKPTWPQLSAATQAERERKGYAPNAPLLRTGELRDSIEYTIIDHEEGQVGSDLDIAVYQELGTSKVVPRPFLEPALKEMAPHIADLAGRLTAATVAGQGLGEIREMLHLLHLAYEGVKEVAEPLFEDQDERERRR
jgi:hypothetical protein